MEDKLKVFYRKNSHYQKIGNFVFLAYLLFYFSAFSNKGLEYRTFPEDYFSKFMIERPLTLLFIITYIGKFLEIRELSRVILILSIVTFAFNTLVIFIVLVLTYEKSTDLIIIIPQILGIVTMIYSFRNLQIKRDISKEKAITSILLPILIINVVGRIVFEILIRLF